MGAQIGESTRELMAALAHEAAAHRAARRWNWAAGVSLLMFAAFGAVERVAIDDARAQLEQARVEVRAQAATSQGWESEVRLLAGAAVDARQAELAAVDDRDRWRALALARWRGDPAAQAADFLRTYAH